MPSKPSSLEHMKSKVQTNSSDNNCILNYSPQL